MSTFLARLGRASFRHRGLVSRRLARAARRRRRAAGHRRRLVRRPLHHPGLGVAGRARPARRGFARRLGRRRADRLRRPRRRDRRRPRLRRGDPAGGRGRRPGSAGRGAWSARSTARRSAPTGGRPWPRCSSTCRARSSTRAASTRCRRPRRPPRTPASRSPSAATPSARTGVTIGATEFIGVDRRRPGPRADLRLAARGRHEPADGAHRHRRRHGRAAAGLAPGHAVLDRPDPGPDDRPGGRHRLRAVHPVPAPHPARRRHGPGGVGRPGRPAPPVPRSCSPA